MNSILEVACTLQRAWAVAVRLSALAALALPIVSFAQSTPSQAIFGPVSAKLPTSSLITFSNSFSVPASVTGPYLLRVQLSAPNSLTALSYRLNNVQVLALADFAGGKTLVDRTVTVQANNSVSLRIAGKLGTVITVTVFATPNLPKPTTLTPDPLTVTVGASGTLTAMLSPTPIAAGTLNTSSANTAAATVPANVNFASGQTSVAIPVTTHAAGSAIVTASANGGQASATVNVTPAPPTVTSLAPQSLTVTQGASGNLTVTISVAQAANTQVLLATSNANIASVASTVTVPAGQVSAPVPVAGVSPGTAQIIASLNGSSASSNVTVNPAPPTVVALIPAVSTVSLGASTTLTLTISAAQSADTLVPLTATPAGIVSIPAQVTVLAGQTTAPVVAGTLALGQAGISASLNGTTASAIVNVASPPVVVTLLEPVSLTMNVGATSSFPVTINAAQSTNTQIALAVDSPAVLQIPVSVTVAQGQTSAVFTATGLAVGNAVITASANGTSKTSSVHVSPQAAAIVSLLPNSLPLQEGATGSLTATINVAQEADTVIALANDAPTVAQVAANVTIAAGAISATLPVNALSTGTANVTASINGTSATTAVTVTPPPPVVTSITPATLTLPKGTPGTLRVTVSRAPNAATTVTLSSSDMSVASVPPSVNIAAGDLFADFPVASNAVGQATITASLNGGSATSTVTITAAELAMLTLSPQTPAIYAGNSVQFTATGTMTDGTSQDFTTGVTWTSSDPSAATINASGLASAFAAGTTAIGASFSYVASATGLSTAISTSTVLTVKQPVALVLTAPTTLIVGNSTTVTVISTDPAPAGGLIVTLSATGAGSASFPSAVSIAAGGTSASFALTANVAGNVTVIATAFERLPGAIAFTIEPALQISAISPSSGPAGTVVTLTGTGFDSVPANNQIAFRGFSDTTVPAAAITATPTQITVAVPAAAASGPIKVTNARGTTASPLFTVTPAPTSPPDLSVPDTTLVAPAVNPTEASLLANTTAFLYSGANPVQTGVAAGTIVAKRAAVLRGRVMTRDDLPLPGIKITVLGHPEFGQTQTRENGVFDMAVNGGGVLTIRYEKSGFLPVQRQMNTPWQDSVIAPDVVMIPLDTQVTAIAANAAVIQVARGSVASDADGTRQATMLFAPGTTASMTLPDGSTQALTTLNVRATEYTVGPNGPKAMPGALPSTSGYTYAVELSVDEAIAAGAKEVRFSQPVPVYVENFLNFPVGGIVPAGYYDRDKAAWIPAPNGRVIKVLSVTGGLADLDTDGDGLADDATKLAALNITAAERQQLATLYHPGASLWRVPASHFTPWDYNWPYGPPPDATDPKQPPPETDKKEDSPNCRDGSIIECQNQTLGERLPVTGTPFDLNYRSDRVPGRKTASTLNIRLSGASVPASLVRIQLIVEIAGRQFSIPSFPAAPNQSHVFTWDGLDVYGRRLNGSQTASIRIGYVYPAVYLTPAQWAASFGTAGSNITGNRARLEITLWQQSQANIEAPDVRNQGLGGWTVGIHHQYDPNGQVLILGDGARHSAHDLSLQINTVAGNGTVSPVFGGDGGAATATSLPGPPIGVTVDRQGNLFFAAGNHILKVSADGIITTVAGDGEAGFSGDGGPATAARLNRPSGVAIDPQGNLFIADNGRIRKVSADGIISTVAGMGGGGFNFGDGVPATEVDSAFAAVAIDPQGSLFIADEGLSRRIRKVSPDGIITTVAGNGFLGFSGDGGAATEARLSHPRGITLDPQGNLFFADSSNLRIRKVSPDGIITTVAGNGVGGFSGDGGAATVARLQTPQGVTLDSQGNLFIADTPNNRIRKVSADGIISTVAGPGVFGFVGDGGAATAALLRDPQGVAIDPQGNLFIADSNNLRIRKVSSRLPGFGGIDLAIPSTDGAQVYHFDATGRHVRTLDAKTQAVVYAFSYSPTGYLIQITDGDGNKTLIERDAAGSPAAIVSADGQRTTLTLDANGYLASVTNPAGEATRMAYSADGLLTTYTDPRGNASSMEYDALGRLTRDQNAAGGFWALSRNQITSGYEARMSSAEGRTTTYRVERLATGDKRRTNIFPDGTQMIALTQTNGATTVTAPDGTLTTTVEGPDPRFGMQAPIIRSATTRTPSGLTHSLSATRAATLSDPNNPLSLITQTDTVTVNGKATTSVYTAAARQRATTSPLGRTTITTVDTQGRPVFAQIAGIEAINLGYDIRGRLATITQGSGADTRTLTYAYGIDGFIESVTDALTRQVIYQRDAAGRPTQTTLPGGRVLGMSFDANGNTTSIVPPAKPPHGFGYTPVDLEAQYNPPALPDIADAATRFTYNRDQDLTQISRPDGGSVAFSYNTGGKLAAVTPSAGAGSAVSYGYSATTGQLASIGSADAALSMSYNGLLLTQEVTSGAISGSIARGYDANFRLTSLTVNGASTAYGYDFDGLLTQAGPLSIARHPSHGAITGTTLGSLTTSQSYNGFGELASFGAAHGATPLLAYDLSYDKLGRIISKSETVTGGATTLYNYTYDGAGRLASASQNGSVIASWGFDANGNRTQLDGATIASVDAQDRLLSYGTTSYLYTPNGSLQEKTQGAQTTGYAYDAFGNLKTVELPGGGRIDYLTDGRNRRIGKKINGALVQGFVWQNQLRVAAELDGANNVIARFVYGEQPNVPETMIKGGVTYRLITDHLGSVRLVVDAATGAIAQRIDYDAWGQVTSDSNPGFQPFGYAGGMYEPSTGLVRFGARDYDAQTGRWTAKDPIRFRGGDANLYSYVKANPILSTDPYGLWPFGAPGRSQAEKIAPGQLQRLVPELTKQEAEQLSKDAIQESGWGDVTGFPSPIPSQPPKTWSDLTDAQKEFIRDFLDRLPERNKDAIEKVKKYCVPKQK